MPGSYRHCRALRRSGPLPVPTLPRILFAMLQSFLPRLRLQMSTRAPRVTVETEGRKVRADYSAPGLIRLNRVCSRVALARVHFFVFRPTGLTLRVFVFRPTGLTLRVFVFRPTGLTLRVFVFRPTGLTLRVFVFRPTGLTLRVFVFRPT